MHPNHSSPRLEEREPASGVHATLDPNFSDVNPTVIEKDEEIETGIHTDGGGMCVEELSVKTLAN